MFFSKKKSEEEASGGDSESPAVAVSEADVRNVLREVYDPEIGINIVDLGLIYAIEIDARNQVTIRMTLTTPGCPYGPQLLHETEYMTRGLKGVTDVDIVITWDPPWSMEMVSEEVRLDMGLDW